MNCKVYCYAQPSKEMKLLKAIYKLRVKLGYIKVRVHNSGDIK